MWLQWLRLGMFANIRSGRNMAEVLIFERGIQIDRVTRPIRSLDGHPAVKYRRLLWPLIDGNKVLIDGCECAASTIDAVVPACAADVLEDETSAEDELQWEEEQLRIIKAGP